MQCYGVTDETIPFIELENADKARKYGFYLTNNEDYDTDVVEYRRGVGVLDELAENGIITEEEQGRRKQLLEQYLDYQQNDSELTGLCCSGLCFLGLSYMNLCWVNALRFVYYTEAED